MCRSLLVKKARHFFTTIQELQQKSSILVQRQTVVNLINRTIHKIKNVARDVDQRCLDLICRQEFKLVSVVGVLDLRLLLHLPHMFPHPIPLREVLLPLVYLYLLAECLHRLLPSGFSVISPKKTGAASKAPFCPEVEVHNEGRP